MRNAIARRAVLSGMAVAPVVAATTAKAAVANTAATEPELLAALAHYCRAAEAVNTFSGDGHSAEYKALTDAGDSAFDAVASFKPTTLLGALVQFEFGTVEYLSDCTRNAVRSFWRLAREQEPARAAEAYALLSKLGGELTLLPQDGEG